MALGLSCGSRAPEPPPKDVRDQMSGHFVDALGLRRGLMEGDLVVVKRAARLLLEAPVAGMDAKWTPHLERLRAAAGRIVEARHMATAAENTGTVLASCGAGHAAGGRAPLAPPPPWPPVTEGLPDHMQQHHLAVRRLWEGLVLPSPGAWREGLDLLAKASYPSEETLALGRGVNIGQLADAAVRRGRGLPRGAWSLVYADVMTTCSHCHAER